MLATCCRVGEITKAQWQALDMAKKTWTIPAENSKNGKPHTIYLSDFAMTQFGRLQALAQSERWLFPNRYGSDHLCDKTIAKQVNSRQNPVIYSNRTKHNTALMLTGGHLDTPRPKTDGRNPHG
jgi:integrase